MALFTASGIRPCSTKPQSPNKNKEILHGLRVGLELRHRWFGTWMQIRAPLTLPTTLPLEPITSDHLQDCCNKSTAVYHTARINPREYIYNAIYKQWYHGHQTNVEFGHYPAKIIRLANPAERIGDIVRIHHKLYDQVAGLQTQLKSYDGSAKLENLGMFGVNWAQHDCYKLRPSFRALIIVVDSPVLDAKSDQTVHLVPTGISNGLSAPITFDAILDSDRRPDPDHQGAILTSLQNAIHFIMELERREMEAQWDDRDRHILDISWSGLGTADINAYAKELDYTGGPIEGPSTSWVHCKGYDISNM